MKTKNLWWIAAGALALMTAPVFTINRRNQNDQQDHPRNDAHLADKWRQAELWHLCNGGDIKTNDA